MVAPCELRGPVVGVVGAGEDPPSFGDSTGELLQQAPALLFPCEQAEVVPEEQNRVEAFVRAQGGVQRSEPHVHEPALLRNLDSQRRDVDSHHFVTAALQVQADAPGAATEIEHAPPHEPHRAAFLRPPGPKRREVKAWVAREDVPVVTLDDLETMTPGDQIPQQVPEGVLSGSENGA